MKNPRLVIASLSLLLFFSHCTPDQTLISSTEEILTRSSWTVDYYFETQDMTSQYENYRLLFSNTGTVTVQIGNEINSGTWNKTIDTDNNEMITLDFNTADINLSKLNQEWKLINRTSSTIEFEDASQLITTILFRIKKQ